MLPGHNDGDDHENSIRRTYGETAPARECGRHRGHAARRGRYRRLGHVDAIDDQRGAGRGPVRIREHAQERHQPSARDELKHRLIGSYVVSGTDPDGKPYAGAGIVDIALAPSGALELDWDNGKQVGVAQLIGDTLVVACLFKGRTAILMMTSNPDGSLAGKWSRRTDRGQKGTETWTKA